MATKPNPGKSVPPKSADPVVRAIATNKKALFNLEVDYTLEAGISLVGSEVKSLRGGCVLIQGAHVRVLDAQAMLFGLTINEYGFANRFNHVPDRPRRLLLHANEIERLGRELQAKGCTAVLSRLYWVGSKVKVEIAVGVGRKEHDKRHAIRDRESKRELSRVKR